MIREDTLYMLLSDGLRLFEKKAASAGNDSAGSRDCRRERSLALAVSLLEEKSRLWQRMTLVRDDEVEGRDNEKMTQLLRFSIHNRTYPPAKPTALNNAQQTSPGGYSDMSAFESPSTHRTEALVCSVSVARERALYRALKRNRRSPEMNVTLCISTSDMTLHSQSIALC